MTLLGERIIISKTPSIVEFGFIVGGAVTVAPASVWISTTSG
jgi:hypothetical protein